MNQKEIPEISVVMSVYNQMNFEQMDLAIYSIINQTFKDFEFIIYSDGSEEKVNLKLLEYASIDKRIRIMQNSENNGLAYSLNTCIRTAKGKYIARMDADDVSEINRFQVQVKYLHDHPEVAFVGCNAKLIDCNGVWGTRKMKETPNKYDYLRFSPFIHPTIMIRRTIFEYSCYCESKDYWRCEDYELFMKLFLLGYEGHNIQRELFYYREDKNAYKKRKWKYRVQEFHLRQQNFSNLKVHWAIKELYVIRPIIGAFIPSGLLFYMKRKYYDGVNTYERWSREKTFRISENLKEKSEVI